MSTTGPDEDSTGPTDPTTGDTTTGSTNEPGGPQILSLTTNVTSITAAESVIFTAVVTDPDGVDDLIGGTLETPEGNAYGAFTTTAQEGAYSMTLAWSALDQVESINFASEGSRLFVVRFFDQSGAAATQNVRITLHCDGGEACDGQCYDPVGEPGNCDGCGEGDLGSNEHCSACDDACQGSSYCYYGECYEPTALEDEPEEVSALPIPELRGEPGDLTHWNL